MDHTPAPNTGPGLPDLSGLPGVNTDRPTPARVYDYLLSGKDNYPADRVAAASVEAREPNSRLIVAQNRMFLRRVVTYLVRDAGIRQIIDLGSGLPTQDNVHQIAQRHAPDTRVIYVDNDPLVLAHGHALLADNSNTAVVTADIRAPERVFTDPDTQRLIDLDQPWALLAVALFHFIPEDPLAVIAPFRERMAPGSYLGLSHLSHDATTPETARHVTEVYTTATAPLVLRTRQEIATAFTGFDLIPPGLQLIMDWRPDHPPTSPEDVWLFGGVGHIPPTT